MDLAALIWRDRVLVLAGWAAALWMALNGLVVGLSAPWPRPLLGLLAPTPLAVATAWGALAVVSTLLFGLAAAYRLLPDARLRAWQSGAASYLLPLLAFALLCVYQPLISGEHLRFGVRWVQVMLLAATVLWLFYQREDVPLEIVAWTGVWAVLVGAARAAFPALPLDFSPLAESLPTGERVTFLIGQVVQIGLLLLPVFLLAAPARRLGARLAEWLVGRPAWQPAAVIALAVLARFAYQLSDTVRLLTPLAALRLLVMLGVLAAGVLAVRALRAPAGPQADVQHTHPANARWFWPALIVILVGYVALAVPLAIRQLDAVNPDGFAYMQVARQYAEGSPVVRGHWAPLISWLMAPLLALGALPPVAMRWVMGLGGLLWVVTGVLFARRFGLSPAARLALAVFLALISAQFAFVPSTPDVLASGIVGLYFYLVTSPRYLEHPARFGLLVGLVGGLAYFGKYYNLPFVLAHLVMTGVLLVMHRQPVRRTLIATGVSLITVAVVAAPWATLISLRYGEPTFSLSGKFNHAIVGPSWGGYSCWGDRLCAGPDDVLYPGEDPRPSRTWSPFESWEYLGIQLNVINSQLGDWAQRMLFAFGFFVPVTLVALVIAALVRWEHLPDRFLYSWTALTVLLHLAGHLWLYAAELRFYLAEFPLLFAAFFAFADSTRQRLGSPARLPARQALAPALLAATFLAAPVLGFTDFVNLTSQLEQRNDPCLRTDSARLGEHFAAPVAGVNAQINMVAFYTNARTYGAVGRSIDDPAAADSSLREHGVRTLLVPDDLPLRAALVADYGYEVVARLPLCGVEQAILSVPSQPSP